MDRRQKILFLCTGNSCRSQMAEGFARFIHRESLEVYSAGLKPKGIDPLAVAVMKEAGITISGQRSKHLDEVKSTGFDWVITLCDNAHETCPAFPGKTSVIHHGFDDPPSLAAKCNSVEEKLRYYRRVRDEIKKFVETLPEKLVAVKK